MSDEENVVIGDVGRGLKRLDTKHRQDADEIAALQAIQKLGGIISATKELQRRLEEAKRPEKVATEKLVELANQINALNAQRAQALELGRKAVENAQAAVRALAVEGNQALAAIRADAEKQAADIIASAEDEAAGMLEASNTEQATIEEEITVLTEKRNGLVEVIASENTRLDAIKAEIVETKSRFKNL